VLEWIDDYLTATAKSGADVSAPEAKKRWYVLQDGKILYSDH
jgi:hypothetical protein